MLPFVIKRHHVLDPTLMPSYAKSPQLFGDVISQWMTRSTIELSLKGENDWSSINVGIHPDKGKSLFELCFFHGHKGAGGVKADQLFSIFLFFFFFPVVKCTPLLRIVSSFFFSIRLLSQKDIFTFLYIYRVFFLTGPLLNLQVLAGK